MKTTVRRTHDKEIYIKENRYDEPKEIFKILTQLLSESGVLQEGVTVSDFGCAAGEFLYYLEGQFPKAIYKGYDVLPELLEKAQEKVPNAAFHVGSVLDKDLLSDSVTDVSFLIGVHSIFDEFEPCFSNLLKWTRTGGRIYIFGLFNPYPIDVWVKYSLAGSLDPTHREPGWNIFSKASVTNYLESVLGKGKHDFMSFEMPFDLPPHADDPVRTWTFLDEQGRRQFKNGLSLICNLEILEIRP